jgi:major membrane immunogen (membrane-anchored lipoprotein)
MLVKKYGLIIVIFFAIMALALLAGCGNDSIPSNSPDQVDASKSQMPNGWYDVMSFCSHDQHGIRVYESQAGFLSTIQDNHCP